MGACRIFLGRWLLMSVFVVYAGCATVDTVEEPEPEPVVEQEPEPEILTAEEGLTPQERFRKVLTLLESGQAPQARAEIIAYLEDRPRSQTVRGLLRQIDTPIEEYFPSESFTVVLEAGESLSTLANKYLGAVYEFFALARYNNIEVPRNTRIGQTIRIPATPGALAAHAGTEETAPEEEVPVVEVAETVEEPVEPEPPATEVIEQLSTAEQLTRMLEEEEFAAAVSLISSMPELISDNADVALSAYLGHAQLEDTSDQDAAESLYSAGTLFISSERDDEALDVLSQAVNRDPAHTGAMEALGELRQRLADGYHREASAAFRAQELDKAIEIWDRVLEIMPDHGSAQVYRAQALELKARLDSLQQ